VHIYRKPSSAHCGANAASTAAVTYGKHRNNSNGNNDDDDDDDGGTNDNMIYCNWWKAMMIVTKSMSAHAD
jgi:hypothetical protein